jgi:hypothetical protein
LQPNDSGKSGEVEESWRRVGEQVRTEALKWKTSAQKSLTNCACA